MTRILDIFILLAIFEISNAYKLKRKETVALYLGWVILIKIISEIEAVLKQLSIIWGSKKRWRCAVMEILWAKISGKFHRDVDFYDKKTSNISVTSIRWMIGWVRWAFSNRMPVNITNKHPICCTFLHFHCNTA